MREKIEQLLAAFEASLDDGSVTLESFQQVTAEIRALESITEHDRLYHMAGSVRLFDAILSRLAPSEGAEMRQQRDAIAALVERKYGSDAPYARSRDIVQEVANELKHADSTDAIADAAIAEISALPFNEADAADKATALLAVRALQAATDWLAASDRSPDEHGTISLSLNRFATALEAGGFDKDAAIANASDVKEHRWSFDGTERGYMQVLMVSVGLALRTEPMALPALSQPLMWLIEAANAVQAEANAEAAQATPPSEIAAKCAALISQFAHDLDTHGFTEYHFRQAMASLQELSPETPADATSIRDALLAMIDLAVPHAPREFAEALPILKRQIMAQDEAAGPAIDLDTLGTEGQLIVERLRTALARGTAPAAAFAQAQFELQTLMQRIPDDQDDADAFGRTMMRLMPELVSAMAPYAEEGKQPLAADVANLFGQAMADMDGALDADEAKAELAGRAAIQDLSSLMNNPLGDPFEQSAAPLYHRQFAAFVRSVTERRSRMMTVGVLAGRDAAEWKALDSRLKIAFDRLAAATTDEQWTDQQRGSLRGAVLGLRRFERRHHLMVIAPAWAPTRTTANPNAVFVSGGSLVHRLVDESARTLEYETPLVLNVNDPTHARWDLLNRSAIAVFDFTSYDRDATEPAGETPLSTAALTAIAQAAAPTARAAYECGWALVLGIPIVIVAHEGQLVPFDVDIEPVRLAGDAKDVERIGVALQAALFGTQRGVSAEGLTATLDYLKRLAARDPAAARLLDAAAMSDATSVRLAAEGVLERLDGRGLMLAIPAFAPAYPPEHGRKTLFHITAFRPWSETCQRIVQEACGESIERRIGYDRFDADIIRSIWNDIATASFVVADLTNLNPNAVIELAIAQALGRPTLVVAQTPNLQEYLPALAKVRIHTYTTDAAGLRRLRATVERFITS